MKKMEKMIEDYCSQEVVKLLKEKGFKIPQYYNSLINMWQDTKVTHQMAMKWLRENKGLFINIGQLKCMNAPIKYRFSIWKDVTYIGKSGDTGDYPTYEEAVEAALKYCLTTI